MVMFIGVYIFIIILIGDDKLNKLSIPKDLTQIDETDSDIELEENNDSSVHSEQTVDDSEEDLVSEEKIKVDRRRIKALSNESKYNIIY